MNDVKKLDLEKIDSFALNRHFHQKRRNGEAYIFHCRKVAVIARQIAADMGLSEQEQDVCFAGGLLHDTIEDTATDFENIEKVASREVAFIVSAVSDDKRQPGQERHWSYVTQLKHSQLHDQIVKLADIIDNTDDSFGLFKLDVQPLDFLVRWHRKTVEIINVLHRVEKSRYYAAVIERLDELLRQVTEARLAISRAGE